MTANSPIAKLLASRGISKRAAARPTHTVRESTIAQAVANFGPQDETLCRAAQAAIASGQDVEMLKSMRAQLSL